METREKKLNDAATEAYFADLASSNPKDMLPFMIDFAKSSAVKEYWENNKCTESEAINTLMKSRHELQEQLKQATAEIESLKEEIKTLEAEILKLNKYIRENDTNF